MAFVAAAVLKGYDVDANVDANVGVAVATDVNVTVNGSESLLLSGMIVVVGVSFVDPRYY